MALYLGNSEKLQVILHGVVYNLNIQSAFNIIKNIILKSSEGYILKDANKYILTTYANNIGLLYSDDCILTDANGYMLIIDGGE